MPENHTVSRCVVVFSGGQDSTTCLVQALEMYDEVYAITFNYGQRHHTEIEVAKSLCLQLSVKHHKIIDLGVLGELSPSALTREFIAVKTELMQNGLPNTFVPGRNIVFLTFAAIYAYQISADTVITGVCQTDFSGYPDCRNEFIKALEQALNLGMDRPLTLSTPLMWLTKAETWALAEHYHALELIQNNTLTCYNGIVGVGCGQCPACQLRQKGLDDFILDRQRILDKIRTLTGN